VAWLYGGKLIGDVNRPQYKFPVHEGILDYKGKKYGLISFTCYNRETNDPTL
jgi:hypothetical protein